MFGVVISINHSLSIDLSGQTTLDPFILYTDPNSYFSVNTLFPHSLSILILLFPNLDWNNSLIWTFTRFLSNHVILGLF